MYLKRRLEPWILVDCLLHREIIQLVCEHDAPAVSDVSAVRLLMNKP
jgi:hypothetical protein